MSEQPPNVPRRGQINMSAEPEIERGVYADFVGVWHQKHCFVLDFAALVRPPSVAEDETGEQINNLDARLVSRVRIPPGQVFEIMKALEKQLSQWERETGQRHEDPDR
jgi:hypothetical protein